MKFFNLHLCLFLFLDYFYFISTVPSKCNDAEFRCNDDGSCITKEYVCDKENDCGDGEDEHNCPCDTEIYFPCKDGKLCLPKTNKCDGYADCLDKSDEEPSLCQQI